MTLRISLLAITALILTGCAHEPGQSSPEAVPKFVATPVVQPPCPTWPSPPSSFLETRGTRYNRAQTLAWLDAEHFALGRWDGSVAVYRDCTEPGCPEPRQLLLPPSGQGVQMLQKLDSDEFVTSNGPSSLAIWRKVNGRYELLSTASYHESFGPLRSAASIQIEQNQLLAAGTHSGHLLVWRRSGDQLRLENAIDLRSSNPIPTEICPPPKDITSLLAWTDGRLIAGSEDGDITVIDALSGTVQLRKQYNDKAKRGINSLSLHDDLLLLANCSVGSEDKNLWLFKLSDTAIEQVDSVNLIHDQGNTQVFNFSAVLVPRADGVLFFASTQEGLLWFGEATAAKLDVFPDPVRVAVEGGAVLMPSFSNDVLAAAAHAVRTFQIPMQWPGAF
ncbi:MAG: hypothetical protein Hals2KO_25240 [Halioglobus sp.]